MEPTMTLHGNLVADPTHRITADGVSLAKFRLASSGRRFDNERGGWVNTDTLYMSVTCWRRLADNVRSSLHKGDTVVVQGRVRFREYDDANGGPRRQSYEIEAWTVAPDLSRYIATLSRPPLPLDGAAGAPVQRDSADGEPADREETEVTVAEHAA
jgi:single-strand DNA-binding protein